MKTDIRYESRLWTHESGKVDIASIFDLCEGAVVGSVAIGTYSCFDQTIVVHPNGTFARIPL